MGGEGSINGMIISLRNNSMLRRKHNVFKQKRGYFESNAAVSSKLYKPLEVRKLSTKEKEHYRKLAQRRNRTVFIKGLIMFLSVLLVLVLLVTFWLKT